MRKFAILFLSIVIVLAAVIPVSAAGTTGPAFRSFLGVQQVYASSGNSDAFPYWTSSVNFTLAGNCYISVKNGDTPARYLVGTHPANTSGWNSFVVLSTPDQLNSETIIDVYGDHGTVSNLASVTVNGIIYNYLWIWVSDSFTVNPSIPTATNINTDTSMLVSYAQQTYDPIDYVYIVPNVSELSYSAISSSGSYLRSSDPYLFYGSCFSGSTRLYRAVERSIKSSDIGTGYGYTFYRVHLFTDRDISLVDVPIYCYTTKASPDSVITVSGTSFTFDDSLGLWTYSYNVASDPSTDYLYIPVFNDVFTLKSIVANFFNTQFTASASYSLPAGNVFVLDLGTSGTSYNLSLKCTMPQLSRLIGAPFTASQFYLFDSSLPSSALTIDSTQGVYIPWVKSSDNQTSFTRQTRDAVFTLSGTSSNRYLYIINPLYYEYDGKVGTINGSVSVSNIPSGSRIYSYPLTTSYNGQYYLYTIDGSGGTGVASPDGGNIQLVNNDNAEIDYSAPFGGNTALSESESIQGTIYGLRDTLSGFFSNILELLGKPVAYIQNLISSGSAFIQQISGLWTWLPSDVAALVTSALIVIICVAVFKVFL